MAGANTLILKSHTHTSHSQAIITTFPSHKHDLSLSTFYSLSLSLSFSLESNRILSLSLSYYRPISFFLSLTHSFSLSLSFALFLSLIYLSDLPTYTKVALKGVDAQLKLRTRSLSR